MDINTTVLTTEELSGQQTRQTAMYVLIALVFLFLGLGLGGRLREYQLAQEAPTLLMVHGQLYKLEKSGVPDDPR